MKTYTIQLRGAATRLPTPNDVARYIRNLLDREAQDGEVITIQVHTDRRPYEGGNGNAVDKVG